MWLLEYNQFSINYTLTLKITLIDIRKVSHIKGYIKLVFKVEKKFKKGVDLYRIIVHNNTSQQRTAANKTRLKALVNKEK